MRFESKEIQGKTLLTKVEARMLDEGMAKVGRVGPEHRDCIPFWKKTLEMFYRSLSSYQRPEPRPETKVVDYRHCFDAYGQVLSDEAWDDLWDLQELVVALEAEGAGNLETAADMYFRCFKLSLLPDAKPIYGHIRRRIESLWLESWGIQPNDRPFSDDRLEVKLWAESQSTRYDLMPIDIRKKLRGRTRKSKKIADYVCVPPPEVVSADEIGL